ncbi:MAG: Rne/Rng family ribonuclease [Bacillota bacterium]
MDNSLEKPTDHQAPEAKAGDLQEAAEKKRPTRKRYTGKRTPRKKKTETVPDQQEKDREEAAPEAENVRPATEPEAGHAGAKAPPAEEAVRPTRRRRTRKQPASDDRAEEPPEKAAEPPPEPVIEQVTQEAVEPATLEQPAQEELPLQPSDALSQEEPEERHDEPPAKPAAKPKSRRQKKPKAKKQEVKAAPPVDDRPRTNREILVSAARDETRVALVEDGAVVEFYVERPTSQKIAGSIFLGKAMNVLPGMQAAFIDIGEEKNAFLYVDDALLPPNLEDTDAAPKVSRKKRQTITDLVRQGQEVMVQVVKEAIGTKGARVTRHVTFPGRYLVLMPTVSYVGVSRRITDEDERQRLRKIARSIKPKDMGIIIRTVAEKKSEDELKRDLDFLVKLWEKVQRRAHSAKAPALIHQDLGLVFRVVRDELNQDTTRMLVDDVHTYGKVLDLLDSVSPEMKDRVIFYRDREYPLFQLYGVDAAIDKALQRQVWLKSGGYLVIDKTEALTVIDVNTGRYVGSKNLADTVFKINIEACEEISRQLRLRDVGGIIVVDFIDMDLPQHRQKLLEELERQLKHDHTKTVVVGITGLGLVEMTRKKVRQSIDATMMRMCPYCGGKGTVMSEETVAARVRREIRRVLRNSHCEAILVEVNPGVASYLIGPGGQNLKDLEKETGRSIFVRGAEGLHLEEMNVKAIGTKEEIADKAIPVQVGDILEVTIEEPHEKNPQDGIARREGYVINVDGAAAKVGQKVVVQIIACHRTYARAKIALS